MSAGLHRALRIVRSKLDYLLFVYGSEWKYIVGLIGIVLGFVVGFVSGPLSAALVVAGVVVTVGLLAADTREIGARWRATPLVPNNAEHSTFPFEVQSRHPEDGSAPQLIELSHAQIGYGGESLWTDLVVNDLLAQRAASVPVRAHRRRYRLPGDLQELAPRALRMTATPRLSSEKRARPPLRFNGMRARLMIEPTRDVLQQQRTLGFQPATYFDMLASNQLWHWSLHGKISEGCARVPVLHVVDARRRLLTLQESRMAHTIGVSMLAITSDNLLIFVEQSEQNTIAPGAFAPSGSGSLDWADVTGLTGRPRRLTPVLPREAPGPSLASVLAAGMLRELHEESKVPLEAAVEGSLRVTAYYRWLSRGAKPEFCGLVRLTCSSSELSARSLSREEGLYTSGHRFVPADVLLEASLNPGASDWRGPSLEALLAALDEAGKGQEGVGRPHSRLSVGTAAAWLAAVAYIRADREYLAGGGGG